MTTILPPPFEWIRIAGGEVTFERRGYTPTTTFDVEPFAIAKYPITNAQFQVFVDAPDGYSNPKWCEYSGAARN